MKFKNIFVTVGTTEFNDLIAKLAEPEAYEVLRQHLGCESLKLQVGRGEKIEFSNYDSIDIEMFDLKDSIAADIEAADLVGKSACICIMTKIEFSRSLVTAAPERASMF